jgi:hypothetical protein
MLGRLPHTVSGISSGGYMAVQHHVVYSSDVDGAATIAGGPFWCAGLFGPATALTSCMRAPELIDVAELVTITHTTALSGFIDAPRNLKGSRVWLFSGTKDTVVKSGVVQKLQKYYEEVGVSDIATVYNISAEHSVPTADYGNACDFLGEPYINDCDFDAAGALFAHLLPSPLLPPVSPAPPASALVAFDQSKYAPPAVGLEAAGLADVGYAFVPAGCEGARRALLGRGGGTGDWRRRQLDGAQVSCRIHMAYHGCHQTLPELNTTFATHAGYNRWAAPNKVVVLYPQARKTVVNPNGCWDWWGYTGINYASNVGLQMRFSRRLLEHVAEALLPPPSRGGVLGGAA